MCYESTLIHIAYVVVCEYTHGKPIDFLTVLFLLLEHIFVVIFFLFNGRNVRFVCHWRPCNCRRRFLFRLYSSVMLCASIFLSLGKSTVLWARL